MPCLRYICPALLLVSLRLTAQEPPKLRLDGNFRPLEYVATLSITPDQDRFSGEIRITLQSSKPGRTVWLNASEEIKIEEAAIDGRQGKVIPGGKDFQGIGFDQPVSGGTLRIRYTGVIDRKTSHGVF